MSEIIPPNPLVAGHQPNFFPWFGYFEKMLKCDVFVFSDDVQFARDYINRVEIPVGKSDRTFQWVLPVLKGHDLRIADKRYMKDAKELKKMLRTVEVNIGGEPHYGDVAQLLAEFEEAYWRLETLGEINIHMITTIANRLGIDTPTRRGVDLGLEAYRRSERLIKRLEILGADTYLSGRGADGYTDFDMFAERNLKITLIDYDLGARLLGNDLKYSIVVGLARQGFDYLAAEIAAWKKENRR